MAIVRWWDPMRDISPIQEKMNQLFEDTLSRARGREEGLGTGMWTPAVDIYETSDAVVVKAELPGLAKEQVDIEIKDGLLVLKGERKIGKDVKEENYHRIERAYGTFQRSFSLPASIDQERVSATLENGILALILPKKEQAKKRQINVAVK